jgi:hypothetical protein
MATLATNVLTLADHAKRMDPDGKIDMIVDIWARKNAILTDMVTRECNDGSGHRATIQTGYPTPTWRKLNYGVQVTKGDTAQIRDECGILEDYSEVDKEVADYNGNTNEFRLSEDKIKLDAMNRQMATMLFYGDQTLDPEKITGLSPRYNSISTDIDTVGYNVISAGGSGSDNTSMWLATWGEESMHCLFPKGSMAGILAEDLGEETLTDAAGGLYQGYRSHYQWKSGLHLKNWKYTVRQANIDVSDLKKDAATGANLLDNMISMYHRLPDFDSGTSVFYCNKTIAEYLHFQAMNKTNVNLTLDQSSGEPVVMFLGIPVRRCDALINAESVVS